MRGYDNNRFKGRAALCHGFECRHMPRWNSLKDYWLGRVADDWDPVTLNRNMKHDAGIRLSA
ncbi:hypothetical protein [Pseudodesulfovibrio sp.]|uniref:hypothetical protein n=1 Tax=Pseudodesulfovibrio sp. TaxID=2035812 RepID=UPI002618292F|nr:hypothetical protein [Pseudodesulfovibrio sp.]MDD3311369.1 hypothetical protein [Pseudodesulfovibrio sp.]